MTNKFCKVCGQKLPNELMSFFSVNKIHEFEDGSYCEKCAVVKVAGARK